MFGRLDINAYLCNVQFRKRAKGQSDVLNWAFYYVLSATA